MTKVIKLTHETLLSVLDLDPATGIFTWKIARSNRVKIGSRAGVFHRPSGGRYIAIDGEKFMAHRLAWFFYYGEWPELEVRPTDRNYDNCAKDNLIEMSRIDLAHQKETATRNNTSGFLGVSKSAFGKFQAAITWNYKQINIGANFDTAEEASEARLEALELFKASKSDADREAIAAKLLLERRKRAAWKLLERNNTPHTWAGFDQFANEVTEVPQSRYAMVAIDLSKPIGPKNYRWTLPVNLEVNSSTERKEYIRALALHNKDHQRDKHLRREYGVDKTLEDKMRKDQNGLCLICEEPETRAKNGSEEVRELSMDHNHDTGEVRGLLCAQCNWALGQFGDNLKLLRGAVKYLERYEVNNVLPFEPTRLDRDWLHVATLGFGT